MFVVCISALSKFCHLLPSCFFQVIPFGCFVFLEL
jgi:hypothetical protein